MTNPYYYSGSCASGVGGAHNYINFLWPMALMVRGLTALEGDGDGENQSVNWTAIAAVELGLGLGGQQTIQKMQNPVDLKKAADALRRDEVKSVLRTLVNTH